ncbi:phage baseplate assembly protein V [Novosphingobium umbonatum]|nr:phage baseplate assembly protein V [Novosphingobium umbonatum]
MMQDDEDIPVDVSTLIRLGIIASVTLSPPRCTVQFGDPDADDGAITSPPVRWLNLRSGDTRHWSPPTVGEEVVLLCPDGQIGNGVVLGGLSNNNFPPAGTTVAELVTYKDGAKIGYDPVGHLLTAILPEGGTVQIAASGGVTIDGPLQVDGPITASEDITGAGISLSSHVHTGVQRGALRTDPPVA